MRSGVVGYDATVVGGGPVPFLDAWDSVRPRTTSAQWNVPGRCGPHGELFFLLEKELMVLWELSRLGPSIRPHGELLLLLMQKKPTFVPDSEAFNSYIGMIFRSPGLKAIAPRDQCSPMTNNAPLPTLFSLELSAILH